jgi:hypothetical protein
MDEQLQTPASFGTGNGMEAMRNLSGTLDKFRERRNEHKRVCLIASQHIEAGVDVDLPVVFRSMAGMDAIAHASENRRLSFPIPGKPGPESSPIKFLSFQGVCIG